MGGSTDVPLSRRVSVWIETVQRLLAHLDIQRVALVSHSAGTIYLMNTLSHCRDILYPDAPVTLLGLFFVSFPTGGLCVCQSAI